MSNIEKQDVANFYARYGTIVHRRALAILGNRTDAEDATQEIFVRVLQGLSQYRGQANLTTWLYRITTNYCLNVLRNRHKRKLLIDKHWPSEELGSVLPSALEFASLKQLLSRADEREATVAVYVWIDGMTRQEAANLLGISERTVYNLLKRFSEWARDTLETEMKSSSPPERELVQRQAAYVEAMK